jgi:beta-lactamase class A
LRSSLARREFLAGACTLALLPDLALGEPGVAAQSTIASLEREVGGRIGVAVLDTGTGRRLAYRADERFAMCSTFKLMLAAAILARSDARSLHREQPLHYSREQLLPNSPVTTAHAADGVLSIEMLTQAAVEVSDNTAANCLLGLIGGPHGYTQFLRGLNDTVTHLDRTETALNSNLPGDPRDTTTPAAMLADMHEVLLGSVLSPGSRTQLLSWMKNCRTGGARLRAHLPAGWEAGDKTGTGERGAVNDLAIFWPPGRPAILIACYLSQSARPVDDLSAVQARIGALVAHAGA